MSQATAISGTGDVFYVTGGTLARNAGSYVERDADRQLYEGISRGEFCDVLTARQMGKSSLMVRVAGKLKEEGTSVAILDITALGQNLTPDQWYEGLLMRLAEQLDLEDEAEDFWDEHRELPPLQRWMRAVRDVVMTERTGRIVIFIDEIDFVRSLNFPTDEFFAAIRECYNRRAVEPDYNRLTFCLIGVATPSDLIRDNRTTPFNIGRRIELPDFTQAQAEPLAKGLGREPLLARRLIDRVLHWTGGHPYLTQRLCKVVAEDASVHSPHDVDRLCTDLFLGHRAKERDDNLIFVRDRMLRNEADRAALLELYQRMWEGREVADDETNPLVAILRLSGIARVTDGRLRVRNRIYAHVFDKAWVTANMPDAELRRQKAAYRRGLVRASIFAACVIFLIGAAIYGYLYAYVLEYKDCYAAAVLKHGLPEGIVHLSQDRVSRRNVSYLFHRRGRFGRVLRIEAVNGHGGPAVSRFGRHFRATSARKAWSGECEWRFGAYDEGGAVYEQAFNRYGKAIWNLLYSPAEKREQPTMSMMRRQEAGGDQVVQARFVNSDDYAVLRIAGQYLEFTYDQHGLEKSLSFTNFVHGPEVGSQHATRVDQTFDDIGRPIEMTFTFPPPKALRRAAWWGPLTALIEPPVTLSLVYERDLLVRVTRTGPNYFGGCASIDLKYDEYGNLVEEKFFDDEGKPATNEGPMRHVAEVLFAAPGFDPDGPRGRFHGWKTEYNSFGDMKKVELLGLDGRPAQDANGFDRWVADYDGRGNPVRRDYFDSASGLVAHVQYDPHGAELERSYTTRPSPRAGTTVARGYYDNGQPSSEITSGFDVKLLGFARCDRSFDREGHETAVKFLDANGTPVAGVPTRCVVAAVMPGTRAEAVYGLRPGDVITDYAGAPILTAGDFYQLTKDKVQAQEWSNSLKLVRNGRTIEVPQVFAVESGAVLASDLDPSYRAQASQASAQVPPHPRASDGK